MTRDQISQYKEAGYTIVPGFFAARETAALKSEVERWVAAGLPRDVSVREGKRNLQRDGVVRGGGGPGGRWMMHRGG